MSFWKRSIPVKFTTPNHTLFEALNAEVDSPMTSDEKQRVLVGGCVTLEELKTLANWFRSVQSLATQGCPCAFEKVELCVQGCGKLLGCFPVYMSFEVAPYDPKQTGKEWHAYITFAYDAVHL